MMDFYAALAVGWLTVLLCSTKITCKLRHYMQYVCDVLECTYCTSFWASCLIVPLVSLDNLILRIPALAALSNVVVLLIQLSMTLFGDEHESA